MFRTLISFAAAVTLLPVAAPVGAVDLESLAGGQRKTYCIAYVYLGSQVLLQDELIDKAEADRTWIRLAHKIQNRGDNYSYNRDFRNLNRAIRTIVDENPPAEEVLAKDLQCRAYLRL